MRKRLGILMFFLGSIVLVVFISQLQSCKHDPANISNLPTVCFDTQIQTIFSSSCAMSGCHSGGSGSRDAGGFNASSYASIMKSVKPGNPWGSKVYTIVSSPNNPNMMPPKGHQPLTLEQRTLIEVWILQGAKETKCNTGTTTGTTQGVSQIDTICFAQDILPIVRSSCATTAVSGVGCHDGSNGEAKKFSDYNSLLSYVNKSNPLNSKIYRVLTGSGEDRMPPYPYSALTSQQITSFQKWLTQGALNSDCSAIKGCDTTGTISFTSKVWPIIQNNCLGCHGSSNPNGSVSLTNYTQVKSYADNLRNSIPIIDGAIRQLTGFKPMPQSGKLSECQIRTVELWIQQGKLNN